MAKKKAKKKEKKMAKKKPARKAAPRKRSASKKSARKKTAKRSAGKTVLKARKPAHKAKRPPQAKPPLTKPKPKEFTVVVEECSIFPPSQHVQPNSRQGSVQFNLTDPCHLDFSNNIVLGFDHLDGHVGSNGPFDVLVEQGEVSFTIRECEAKVGPADIIVP